MQYDGISLDIHVSLTGGKVAAALDAAELAERNDWRLFVKSLCLSACAEILVLGFESVRIEPGGVIGFHGNSKFKNELYKTATGELQSKCFLQFEERRERLQNERGVSVEFWKDQLATLKPYQLYTREKPGAECEILYYELEYDLWIPSTDFLKREYGLNIVGHQATDNLEFRQLFGTVVGGSFKNIKYGE